MNKFSKIVSGLKALLGQKAPSLAVTDIQLDWDNHVVSPEETAVWNSMMSDTCGCGKDMEPGAAVCDDCLEDSEFVIPAVCKGCGKVDRKELLDFCYNCETDGTEFRIRSGESLSDAVDRHAKAPF